MKSILLTLTLIVCLVWATPAQESRSRISTEKPTQSLRWKADAPYAASVWVEGVEIRTLITEKTIVALALVREDKHIETAIFVKNLGEKPLLVDPWFFFTHSGGKFEASVPPEKIAKSKEGRGKWRDILGGFGASLAKKESSATIRDNHGNSARVTVTEPDYETQRIARERSQQRKEENRQAADTVRDLSLKANTVFKDGFAGGFVYFDRRKKDKALEIGMPVGDTLYIFPIR